MRFVWSSNQNLDTNVKSVYGSETYKEATWLNKRVNANLECALVKQNVKSSPLGSMRKAQVGDEITGRKTSRTGYTLRKTTTTNR